MKKIIAMLLALCALAALTASVFAAAAPQAVAAEEPAVIQREEQPEISARLSEADALEAALRDAGETEATVTVTKIRLSEKKTENDQMIPVYSIRFSTETTKYKYGIDGNTGAIIYKNTAFQNPDIVLEGHGHGELDRTGREPGEDSHTVTEVGHSGMHGGHRHGFAGQDAADVPVEGTGA